MTLGRSNSNPQVGIRLHPGLKAHMEHVLWHGRQSHAGCPECRAENERSFVRRQPFRYQHVREYLAYVQPRIQEVRAGAIERAREQQDYRPLWWYRGFIQALNNRISSHIPVRGRKYNAGYLERFGQWRDVGKPGTERVDAAYLRRFAQRGASCLD